MSVHDALGTAGVVTTSQGPIHHRDTGEPANHNGHTLVLNAGFMMNGDLWLPIVPGLHAAGFRVISLDPPSGAQAEPLDPGADLSPPGMAAILGDVIIGLGLDACTLVANDSGCAVSQLLLLSDHPANEVITRVVFTNGDFFENFPPKAFRPLLTLPKIPGAVTATVKALQSRAVWQAPTAFGWLSNDPLPDAVKDSFLNPSLRDEAIRGQLADVLSGIDNRFTIEAAERFGEITVPVTFVWGQADRFFKAAHADKAAGLLPKATVVKIPGARTFVMWDAPEATIAAIADAHA